MILGLAYPALIEQSWLNGFGETIRIRGARPEGPVHKPTCGQTRRLNGRVGALCQSGPGPGDVRPHVARSGWIRRSGGPLTNLERRTCNPWPWSYHVRPPRVRQRQPRSERVE